MFLFQGRRERRLISTRQEKLTKSSRIPHSPERTSIWRMGIYQRTSPSVRWRTTNIEDVLGSLRIVELWLIAQRVDQGCLACSTHLEMIHCVQEERFGLASVIHIRCSAGNWATSTVETLKTNSGQQNETRPACNVSMKVALGKFTFRVCLLHVETTCWSSQKRKDWYCSFVNIFDPLSVKLFGLSYIEY